jgi:hypothetical protein
MTAIKKRGEHGGANIAGADWRLKCRQLFLELKSCQLVIKYHGMEMEGCCK